LLCKVKISKAILKIETPLCPETHRWAMENGAKCCSWPERETGCTGLVGKNIFTFSLTGRVITTY